MGLAPFYNTIANAQNGVNVLNGGGLNFATNVAIPETPLSSLNRQRSVVAEFPNNDVGVGVPNPNIIGVPSTSFRDPDAAVPQRMTAMPEPMLRR